MNANDAVKCRLRPFSLGIAIGVVNGLYMLLFALAGLYFGYGLSFIQLLSQVFYGYAPSVVGGLWGALWGFLDGFVFGLVVGWIYNLCRWCCCCCCCCGKKSESP